MTQLVLVLLAVAWIVVLAPDAARLLRFRRRPVSSVDQFRRQLDSLGRSAPAAAQVSQEYARRRIGTSRQRWTSPTTAMPSTPKQAATRRRDIGTLLVLCVSLTLAGAFVTRSPVAVAACTLTTAASAAFFALVVRRRRAAPTAEVHYLPLRHPTDASNVRMIRRQANQ